MIAARSRLFHFEKILITVESGDLCGEKSQLGNIARANFDYLFIDVSVLQTQCSSVMNNKGEVSIMTGVKGLRILQVYTS